MSETNQNWERKVITDLAGASLKEQRRSRRWGIFFKLLTFAYLVVLLVMFVNPDLSTNKLTSKHSALVDLSGMIAEGELASSDNIVTALRSAFEDKNTAGVILRINSPGGTPVQAGYIYDEITRLRKEHPDTPLYAVISDMCASGGYYVAAAADKIFADKASIVGSIGVRMDNFGFVDAMEKVGVERRTLTAGKNKALLDPFLPVDESVNEHMQSLLHDIHQQFITAVKNGRGDRLKTEIDDLFNGLIWTGEQSVKLGLIDELASSGHVAREVIGEEDIVNFTVTDNIIDRLAKRLGATMASLLIEQNKAPVLK